MDTKKQDKKQTKTQPLANLPVVALKEKDMSYVNGGGYNSWAGWSTSIDVRTSTLINRKDWTMDTKKQDKRQTKTQSLANLPVVTLTEKDMSSVNGGTQRVWGGWLTSIDVRVVVQK